MRYSLVLDAAFRLPWALFVDPNGRKKLRYLVNTPLIAWHHKTKKVDPHAPATYNVVSLIQATEFMNTFENPGHGVGYLLDEQRRMNIKHNRHIVECMAHAVLHCGRQGIAIRRDKETLESSGNPEFCFGIAKNFVTL